jgi:hypothetical protein
MYTFKLNNTVVQTPIGFDLTKFKKERSKIYNGFLQKNIAFNDKENITFVDPIAVKLLSQEFKQKGLSAIVEVSILYNNSVQYSGIIDFMSANWNATSFKCAFIDKSETVKLISNLSAIKAINPNTNITLVNKPIANKITHSIPTELNYIRKKVKFESNTQINIPFSSSESKTDTQSFLYQNNTSETQRINLVGQISGIFNGLGRFNIKLIGTTEFIISTHNNNTANQAFQLPILYNIDLAPSQGIIIAIDTNSSDFSIEFDSSCYLQINELKEYGDSVCGAISVNELFLSLVNKISNGKFNYNSNPLFDNQFITNGKNIRGLNSEINTSVEYLFANLAKIFCIKLDIEDSTVNISPLIESKKFTRIDSGLVSELSYFASTDYAFTNIRHGFKTYSNEDKLGNFEPNSIRNYSTESTNLQTFENLSELITASSVIESVRQLQFIENNTSAINSKFDESLFLIDCEYSGVGYKEKPPRNFTELNGLIDKTKQSNMAYLPSRTIQNFAPILMGHAKELTFDSGFGNIDVSSRLANELTLQFENQNIILSSDAYLSSLGIDVSIKGNLALYDKIGQIIGITNKGQTTLIYVLSAEYSPVSDIVVIGLEIIT